MKRELRWFAAVLPLLWADLRAPWIDEVLMTDASYEASMKDSLSSGAAAVASRMECLWRSTTRAGTAAWFAAAAVTRSGSELYSSLPTFSS